MQKIVFLFSWILIILVFKVQMVFGFNKNSIATILKKALTASNSDLQAEYVSQLFKRLSEKASIPALIKIGIATPHYDVLKNIIDKLIQIETKRFKDSGLIKVSPVYQKILNEAHSYDDAVNKISKSITREKPMIDIFGTYKNYLPNKDLIILTTRFCKETGYIFPVDKTEELENLYLYPIIYKDNELIGLDNKLLVNPEQLELMSAANANNPKYTDILLNYYNSDSANKKLAVRVLAMHHWQDNRVRDILLDQLYSSDFEASLQAFMWLLIRYFKSQIVIEQALKYLSLITDIEKWDRLWSLFLHYDLYKLDRPNTRKGTWSNIHLNGAKFCIYAIFSSAQLQDIITNFLKVNSSVRYSMNFIEKLQLKIDSLKQKPIPFLEVVLQLDYQEKQRFSSDNALAIDWLWQLTELNNFLEHIKASKNITVDQLVDSYLNSSEDHIAKRLEKRLVALKQNKQIESLLIQHLAINKAPNDRGERLDWNGSAGPCGSRKLAYLYLFKNIWSKNKAISYLQNEIEKHFNENEDDSNRIQYLEEQQLDALAIMSSTFKHNKEAALVIMQLRLMPFNIRYRNNYLCSLFSNIEEVSDFINITVKKSSDTENLETLITFLSTKVHLNNDIRITVEQWLWANKNRDVSNCFCNYAKNINSDEESDKFQRNLINWRIINLDTSKQSRTSSMLNAYIPNMKTDFEAEEICLNAASSKNSGLQIVAARWLSWGKTDRTNTRELLSSIVTTSDDPQVRRHVFDCLLVFFGKEAVTWKLLHEVAEIETQQDVKAYMLAKLTGQSIIYISGRPWYRSWIHETISHAIANYAKIEFELYCDVLKHNGIDSSPFIL